VTDTTGPTRAPDPLPEIVEPALTGLDERAMLGGWLDTHRAVLVHKCTGLSDAQLRERAVPPSTLCLLGLLRHLSDVEAWWFVAVLAGEEPEPPDWSEDEDPDADLNPPPDATLAGTLPAYLAACARSRTILAGLESLDVVGDLRGQPVSARWVATHMVEEYARHNGHADLLRERLDGATG